VLLRTVLPGRGGARVLLLAGATGVATGLVMAAFTELTEGVVFHEIINQPLWVQAAAPLLGLGLSLLILRYLAGGATNATSEEYLRAFHDRHAKLPLRQLPGKLLAGVATIGSGGAVGLEGPATYAGATVGASIQARFATWFSRDDVRVLMTAGAAAGVAAVFKTPATGVVFALESPYRDDIAPRALVPALMGSAAGYLTYVSLVGTEPVIGALGATSSLDLAALGGAVLIGLLAGLIGRGFAWLLKFAALIPQRVSPARRVVAAGVILGLLAVAADHLFGASLTLGPGYESIDWAGGAERELQLLAALLVMRVLATLVTVGAGGTGGMFIPLAAQGVLLGHIVAELLGDPESGLFPTIGLAAVLGAAHGTPLAAVTFVAETSQGDVFIIPALIAAACSQIVAGRSTVLAGQAGRRQGHLEKRLELPLATALRTDAAHLEPEATVNEFLLLHVVGRRERVVPVVDADDRYVGLCALEAVSAVERSQWEETAVADILQEVPPARLTWSLGEALAAMDANASSLLAVCDDDGGFVGVIEESEIVKLDEILDETGG
jgi:chloride channel protein, CIC family